MTRQKAYILLRFLLWRNLYHEYLRYTVGACDISVLKDDIPSIDEAFDWDETDEEYDFWEWVSDKYDIFFNRRFNVRRPNKNLLMLM